MKINKIIRIIAIVGVLLTMLLWSYCTGKDVYVIDIENPDFSSILSTVPSTSTNTDTQTLTETTSNTNISNSTTTAIVITSSTGTPADSTPPTISKFSIDNEALTTSDLKVLLVIIAEDESSVDKMATSNDGTTWSEWIDYYPVIFNHDLAAGGNGTRTVYIKVKDVYGNVSTISQATIDYQAAADTINPVISAVAINNGDASTSNLGAQAVVLASDNVSVTEMAWSIDGVTYSAWELYTPIIDISLAVGDDGIRTVYIKVRDGANNESAAVSDTIDFLSNVYVNSSAPLGNPCSKTAPCNTIQAGLDAAQTLGLSTVNVAQGTYTESLVITSDISLIGGWNSDFSTHSPSTYLTTIKPPASVDKTISYFNISNAARLEGFTIKGSQTETPTYAIYCAFHANVTITNNKIIGNDGSALTASFGIYVANNSSPEISKNEITATTGSGTTANLSAIYITGVGSNPVITTNFKIVGSRGTGAALRYGIYTANGAQPTITENQWICGTENVGIGYGIYLDSSASATIQDNVVISGSETVSTSRGIFLDNGSNALIKDNQKIQGVYYSGAGYGIYLENHSYASINSNDLIQGGFAGTSYGIYGGYIDGKTVSIIDNTTIKGATVGTGYGINLNYTSNDTINIKTNTTLMGSESGASSYALYMGSTTTIYNSNTFDFSDNTNIIGTISGSGDCYAIYVANYLGTTSIARNNTIIGSQNGGSGNYYAIYAYNQGDLTIEDTVTKIQGSGGSATTAEAIRINNAAAYPIHNLKIEDNPLILGASGNVTTAHGIYDAYYVDTSVYIKNNTIIKGTTANATNARGIYFQRACTANSFEISGSNQIIGADGSSTTLGYGIHLAGALTNVTISNLQTVRGSGGDSATCEGINCVGGGTSLTINNITTEVVGCIGNSITSAAGMNIGAYTNISIDGVPLIQGAKGSADGNAYGMIIGASAILNVTNNTLIKGAGGPSSANMLYGINLSNVTSSGTLSNNAIVGGYKIGPDASDYAYGMYVNGSISTNFVIQNNTMQGSSVVSGSAYSMGFYIYNGSPTVKSNTILGAEQGGTVGDIDAVANNLLAMSKVSGVFVDYSGRPIVENNIITGNSNSYGSGVIIYNLYSSTTQTKINRNFIRGSAVANNDCFGIQHITDATVFSANSIAVITNNVIKANNGNGLRCAGYHQYSVTAGRYMYDVVSNNLLYGGGGSGVVADASYGIAIYNSNGYTNARIYNNIIYNADTGSDYCYAIGEVNANANRGNPYAIENNLAFKCQYWYRDYNASSVNYDFTVPNPNNNAVCNSCSCINNLTTSQTLAELFKAEGANDYSPPTVIPPYPDYVDKGRITSGPQEGSVIKDYAGSVSRPKDGNADAIADYDIGPYEYTP